MSALMPTYARSALDFERGEGAWLVTADGERYLDFGAGIAVNALGHAHPDLVAALVEQAGKLWHTSNLYQISAQERLAERLAAASFADLVFFANSGAEAMECAIKLARKYQAARGEPDRFRVITFAGAFHGRTLAMLAAGGKPEHLEGFGPAVEGFDQVEMGDIDAVEEAIGDNTAAILIEPVQGEGGVNVAPRDFVGQLRALCDTHGLTLIFDEVQTGLGRTGRLFAYEWLDVEPDIMAIAKALGGGFPVGACLARAEIGAVMAPGSHGSTFGGNPLAMAVANAVLDIVLEPGFLEGVQETGLRFKQKLAAVRDTYPGIVEEVRGEGLLLGLRCGVPNSDLVKALAKEKMLSVPAADNVVRLLPPLIVGDEEIDEACLRLERACAELSGGA
jgi:acetylornithine/N-succinyldiaminopimelate aminotransferase